MTRLDQEDGEITERTDDVEPTRRSLLQATASGIVGAGALTGNVSADSGNGQRSLVDGPVLFATAEMIDEARKRVAAGRDPWSTAFEHTKSRAINGLDPDFIPYQKGDYLPYFRTARRQGGYAIQLGVAYAITGKEQFAAKAREILLEWADDAVENGHDNPAANSDAGQGLVIGRAMTKFCYAYTLVWEALSDEDRDRIEIWMRLMVPHLKDELSYWHDNDYLGEQYYNNHLGACTMGISSIGFALDDQQFIRYALMSPHNPRNFQDLLEGTILVEGDDPWYHDPSVSDYHLEGDYPKPQTGEVFDRYRIISGHGINYAMLHLRFLTLVAEAALNNAQGRNRYTNTLDLDESLELAYEFYADFFITGDPAIKGGYYARDDGVPTEAKILYEIAHRRYPDNEKIEEVLAAGCSRNMYDLETFGWTLPLTHGVPGIERDEGAAVKPDAKRAWEFEEDGNMEEWQPRKNTNAEVSGGALHLEVTGPGPDIISDDRLLIDGDTYNVFRVRMRNQSDSDLGIVYFSTMTNCGISRDKRVGFSTEPESDYVEYAVDMSQNSEWGGAINKLRFDYIGFADSGSVDIDYVRLTEN